MDTSSPMGTGKSGMGTTKKAPSAGGTMRRGAPSSEKSLSFNKSSATNVAAEKVQQYGEAFEKIQKATGIEHIDDLVNSFLDAEDRNYTLLNYVNEVRGGDGAPG